MYWLLRLITRNVWEIENKCSQLSHYLREITYKVNLSFMCDTLQMKLMNRPPSDIRKLKLEIRKTNKVKFGTKNWRTFGPKIWGSLTHHIKSTEILITLKRIKKDWNKAQCKVCQSTLQLMWYFLLQQTSIH